MQFFSLSATKWGERAGVGWRLGDIVNIDGSDFTKRPVIMINRVNHPF
jgi:hypothetical protein